jgi:2,3-bisphosphoglycerate-independent phosphoglycerate mutase
MDFLAERGEVGVLRTIPDGFEPGSDVANLTILGYNPRKFYSGRAPIEAAYRGIKLGQHDVAYRCNLVTLKIPDIKDLKNAVMEDYSAGHITTKEAKVIIDDLNKVIGNKYISFYSGVSYRHIMVWKNGRHRIRCTPPHDISGRKIERYLPEGNGDGILRSIMEKSVEFLSRHRINRKRIESGLRPANSIWLWGQGRDIEMPTYKEKYRLRGTLISAVDLTRGLGIKAGFRIIKVRGATGYLDTNYEGKAMAALRSLRDHDIAYVHVEAPDEAGHNGDVNAKVKAIEDFDKKVVGEIIKGVKRYEEYSILVLPDHFTPVSVRTHTDNPVPYVIYRNVNEVKRSDTK